MAHPATRAAQRARGLRRAIRHRLSLIQGKMFSVVDSFVNTIVVFWQAFVAYIVAMARACFPVGMLGRKNVHGQICLITGAGSGIGRLMAIEFAKLGCIMVLWDANKDENEETKEMIEKTLATVHAYTVNLSKREQIGEVALRVMKEVGNVDILVNNAGVVTGKPLLDSPDDYIERTMAINASACLYTAKHFVKPMTDRNRGHVVTIASIGGKYGGAGAVDYGASKHAAVGYHDSLCAELRMLGADGVKMTLVMPYFNNSGNGVAGSRFISNLEPEYVVECIMEAVLTDKEELIMPKILYVLSYLNFLPTEAKHLIHEYLGISELMESFEGRTKMPTPTTLSSVD